MIEHDELCRLIPHSGKMCLLERVIRWDSSAIECETSSHLLPDNPLRREASLSSVNLVEYGAQAMAVHGGLLAREQGGRLGNGYLAALREVQISQLDISRIGDKLHIMAERLISQDGNLIYRFRVTADDACLMQGRATVVALIKPGSGGKQ